MGKWWIFPNGAWGFAASLAVVMFSFGGVDLIGITAGEAENPEKNFTKSYKSNFNSYFNFLYRYYGSIDESFFMGSSWSSRQSICTDFL